MKRISTILSDEILKSLIMNNETVVLNFKKHYHVIEFAVKNKKVVRCDRKSIYGNKHVMKDKSERERERVVRAYWLDIKHGRTHLKEKDFRELIGKALVCWCSPLRCHCDALKFVADKLRDGHTFDEIKQM